ncbi:MAG TPA: DUF4231 domain-containing protein [Segetibacter sp.]|nr:DUF4231 domain-containing protein [Segetibacter sp.]
MNTDTLNKQTFDFPNGNQATAVFANSKTKAEDIISELQMADHKAVILIVGGADDLEQKSKDKLTQLFSRGIARGAIEGMAVLVDGGTKAGVMELMGEGVAARGNKTPLIGVAPSGKISIPGGATEGTPLDPNHSHFVIVEGAEWGNETSLMFNLVKALTVKITDVPATISKQGKKIAETTKETTLPSLLVVAGGGEVTKKEILRAVRQNMRIIVIEESGGFADEIAKASKNKEVSPDDPLLAEILSDGDLHFHKLSSSVKGIERLIIRELGVDKVLMQAWETFAMYDQNANEQQKFFGRLQMVILLLGVVGTALIIIQQIWGPKDDAASTNLMSATDLWKGKGAKPSYFYWWLLHNSLIIMPILLSVLVTAAARFKQGSKWLLLRAAAESIKREIYRYRTRSMYYKELAEQQLALKIEDITRRTMRTEVNTSSLKPYDVNKGLPPRMDAAKGQDDGISYLVPDRYIELRLDDQLNFFKTKAVKLEKQLKLLYWSTFLVGGLGSYLAAINMQVWVALTTTVVAAFGTYLGYRQVENTLIKYNQAATDLANVKAWWNALGAEDQSLSANIDSLVSHTEQVLQTELDGWIQQMQNSLAELREDQKKKYEKEASAPADKQEGPTISPGAAPPAKPVASEEKAGEVEDVNTESDDIAQDGTVKAKQSVDDKTEEPPSVSTDTMQTTQAENETKGDEPDAEPATEDEPGNKEGEIEISATSSAALIGEIEETVPEGNSSKLEKV